MEGAKLRRRDFLRAAGISVSTIATWKVIRATPAKPQPKRYYTLFPTDLPERQWVKLRAEGFSRDAVGVIYRGRSSEPFVPGYLQATPAVPEYPDGMKLGGLGTGYVSLTLEGCLGEWTIYNNLVNPFHKGDRPHYGPEVPIARSVDLPFLGLAIDDNSWVLATRPLKGVGDAQKIHYWGHYPVADLEYDLEAPVSVGLRAWVPFLPGDAPNSNVPGAVFEVHLRNMNAVSKRVTVIFSFPGPAEYETLGKATNWERKETNGNFCGVVMAATKPDRIVDGALLHGGIDTPFGYALGVVGPANFRHGGFLGADGAAWADAAKNLPTARPNEPGASLAVDITMDAQETKTVRFVLAWYAPFWPGTHYTNMYRSRFNSSLDVAQFLAKEHQSLLQRVLAWQEVIYGEGKFSEGVRDALVNSLYLMTAGSSYVRRSGLDTGKGLLSIVEAGGSLPLQETMICASWGSYPALYFFPELRRITLRAFADLQAEDGRLPFWIGNENCRLDTPKYTEQDVVNALYYTQMVYALYQRTNDVHVLQEFYPSIKRAIQFETSLDNYGNGLVGFNPNNPGANPFEWGWFGVSTYVAGHWLCSLRIAERIAEKCGDVEFARQCRSLIERATRSLEETLWNDTVQSYLLYTAPDLGKRSDLILLEQFEGEFTSLLLGLPGSFRADRVRATLQTMKRLCVKRFPAGIPNAVRPDGIVDEAAMAQWIFPQSNEILAATYAYFGDQATAEEILHNTLGHLVLAHQMSWDFPGGFLKPDGSQPFVPNYYNGMAIWMAAPGLLDQNLQGFCAPGQLVDRVIEAARTGHAAVNG